MKSRKTKKTVKIEHKKEKELANAKFLKSHSDAYAHSVAEFFGDTEHRTPETMELDPKKFTESRDKLPTK